MPGKHRAGRHKTNWQRELKWLQNYWRYFRHYRRNQCHPWPLEILHRLAQIIGITK